MKHPGIVILTGAGISAESGIQTFRGDGGLWEGHRVEDVATPEGFARDPELVQKFYNERRAKLLSGIAPNAGHEALARLQKEYSGKITLVTQNIDDLHERAGSENVLHMHGELLKARCLDCGEVSEIREQITAQSPCRLCDTKGRLRPDIVWFGEMPYFLSEIESSLENASLFIAVGTSGKVYPAAGFVEIAKYAGATTIEVNLEKTDGSHVFHRCEFGPAGKTLPRLVSQILTDPTALS